MLTITGHYTIEHPMSVSPKFDMLTSQTCKRNHKSDTSVQKDISKMVEMARAQRRMLNE